jgi:beta-glucanase (GH16 family)
MLFAGYPVLNHYLSASASTKGGFNLGGTNGTGQVANLSTVRTLIDTDTPSSAMTFTSTVQGKTYDLQFSDEFEVEGRTFWPGDDQYVRIGVVTTSFLLDKNLLLFSMKTVGSCRHLVWCYRRL